MGQSIQQRMDTFLQDLREEGCCGGGGMAAGGDGFEGSSAAEGPTAGFDPLMGALKRLKKKKDKEPK